MTQRLPITSSLREVFRYAKANRVRIYNLKVLSDETSELWVASEENGRSLKSRKLVTFDNREDVAPFLQDIERELRAGGWSRLSGESLS